MRSLLGPPGSHSEHPSEPYPHPRGPLPSPPRPLAHSSAGLLLTALAPQAAHPTHFPRTPDNPTHPGPLTYRQDPSGIPSTPSPSPHSSAQDPRPPSTHRLRLTPQPSPPRAGGQRRRQRRRRPVLGPGHTHPPALPLSLVPSLVPSLSPARPPSLLARSFPLARSRFPRRPASRSASPCAALPGAAPGFMVTRRRPLQPSGGGGGSGGAGPGRLSQRAGTGGGRAQAAAAASAPHGPRPRAPPAPRARAPGCRGAGPAGCRRAAHPWTARPSSPR